MVDGNILEIHSLTKSFGDKKVICGLDLSVPYGKIFGFVGRNGVGKTTVMKTVLGLLKPDSGEIFVNGERVEYGRYSTNRYVGYLPDVPEFYQFMTPVEYLRLCGECSGMSKGEIEKRSLELLALVGLTDESGKGIKGFSRGMKQRLGIAQALFNRPKLLLCDEPTSALDPVGRREILDILLSVKSETTVVFSTHILSDVERICDNVALLEGGVIAMQGGVEELKRMNVTREFSLETVSSDGLEMVIKRFPECKTEGASQIVFNGGDELMREVMLFVAEKGIAISKIERHEPSLESLCMEVIAK